jgi:hypothetical protein
MYIQGGHCWKYGGLITDSSNGNLSSLSTPLAQFYIIQCSVATTITLPDCLTYPVGTHVLFKRYLYTTGEITFKQPPDSSQSVFITYKSATTSTSALLTTSQYQCEFINDGYLWLQINTQ